MELPLSRVPSLDLINLAACLIFILQLSRCSSTEKPLRESQFAN